MEKKFKIFMLVIVVLFLIVMSVPPLFDSIQARKQKDTLKKLIEISDAIEKYKSSKKKIPEVKTVLELKSILQPLYIEKIPLIDGWGNYFQYHYEVDEKKQSYCIGSGGKDGKFKGFKQEGAYRSPSGHQFNKDIILSNGKFIYYPLTSYTVGRDGIIKSMEK